MSEEFATIAYRRRCLSARDEKAVEFIVSEDNKIRLRLKSRLDEILIPYRKHTELDFSVPEEIGSAEVDDDVLKVVSQSRGLRRRPSSMEGGTLLVRTFGGEVTIDKCT